MTPLPILYSFRRCPYAIRARLALSMSHIEVIIREVDLKQKPACLLKANPNGTVPTLILSNQTILNQSLDIVEHCCQTHDGEKINLSSKPQQQYEMLLNTLTTVQNSIHQVKYNSGTEDLTHPQDQIRKYLELLSKTLDKKTYLVSDHFSKADINIVPFIRQLYLVDTNYFTLYPKIKKWLLNIIESEFFSNIMQKFPVWHAEQDPILF